MQTPEIIGFATRLFGSIVLLFFSFRNEFTIGNLRVFLVVTGVTAILTAITTLIRLKLIRTADISLTTPWLGLVPLFMVFWSAVILKELPGIGSFVGISLVCLGSFIISFQRGNIRLTKAGLLMLLVAGVLGLTTTLDKLAVGAASAFTYTFYWTILSAVLMWGVAKQKGETILIFNRHLIIQAVFWVVGFLSQMLAVQYAFSINSGTTYVKTLTMLNIVVTTIAGSLWFKEKDAVKRGVSALLIFGGAVCLIVFK